MTQPAESPMPFFLLPGLAMVECSRLKVSIHFFQGLCMASDTGPKDATQSFGSIERDYALPEKIELRPGIKLNGRYVIEKELGRGGIGVVYLARDERLHAMPVVIKFLLEDTNQNAWLQKKFFQEAEALARLNHPGIVRVIDRDQAEDGKPFFVMEFVKGTSLRSALKADGMDFEYAAHLIKQIGQALDVAHREGIFHRDLKPENIMLQVLSNGDEQIKLIDFGIAKVQNSQTGSTTEVSIVAGSLSYMAPEQLLAQPVSAATDIYALAILAYEMVTGRRPFTPDATSPAAAIQQVVRMQQSEDIVPPQRLRPSLTIAAQGILLKALSCDPARRPQDARVFGEELASALCHTLPSVSLQATVIDTQQPSEQATLKLTNLATENIAPQPTARVSTPPTFHQQTSRAVVPAEGPNQRGKYWVVVALLLIAALVGGIVLARRLASLSEAAKTSSVPTTAPGSATAEPERLLTYSVTVQQDPKRYPGKKPFQLPGEMSFSAGDRVRFSFASPQAGYLYILNESPALAGGKSIFNVLFPSSTSNNNSAQLSANQIVVIPGRGDGFIFDDEVGTEKLWLVWSANAVADLEALKKWANSEDKGEIKDQAQAGLLRDFLVEHSLIKPDVQRDDVNKQTVLKGKGDLLIRLINLEHH
jgi:serine/threonine-protein kinase